VTDASEHWPPRARSAAVLGCECAGRLRPVNRTWPRDAARTRRRRRLRYGGSARMRRRWRGCVFWGVLHPWMIGPHFRSNSASTMKPS